MARQKPMTFLKITELFTILLFLAIGFATVAVPVAYGSIASAGAPSAPVVQQPAALTEAAAACAMVKTKSRTPVSDCGWTEWKAFDLTVPVSGTAAAQYCDAAARDIAANFRLIAGKSWTLYLFSKEEVRPTAVCRVP